MTYFVNEIFYTLQGEGYWTGRPAVFCRFSRCNLWTGKEEDRHRAICSFCDTDFSDYTEYTHYELARVIKDLWPGGGEPMVVFTGGEPALQLDFTLVKHLRGWYTAVETNGTVLLEAPVNWVCVSPKTPRVRITAGDELKLVYPQERITPNLFENLSFRHFWISPMDGPSLAENTAAAVEFVKANPKWRLNTQVHKTIGIP
ncbi:7-carboxy-7-deazaguanine synthase [Mycolicibacterium phlei]|uniref:7-carboxy-7-deazaguanine synthase n=1 Tax=Mycolicibacterium phlei TaxID=1771 RepID=UPI00025AE564|nr:7-carboxy-7-deazaguanine synthase [Mycolicibacterium phlei]EID10200.1 hypothetical protein MPHLEI_22429 [Mycolicibacterium phlei RIVM601174]MBF4194602.1 hypothetical protein [Mycolicibacterium phlei]